MDTGNDYLEQKSKNISKLNEKIDESVEKAQQYKNVYETMMGDKLQKYSAMRIHGHKSNIMKLVDHYEAKTMELTDMAERLKADFPMGDMCIQERIDDLSEPESSEDMQKCMHQLDNAVAQYNKYKGMLGKDAPDSVKDQYQARTALYNIMSASQKMSPREREKALGHAHIQNEAVKEFMLQKASISDADMSENEKVFLLRKQKEELDVPFEMIVNKELDQKYQKNVKGFEEAAEEHAEKKDVLLQVEKLAEKSHGAENEDPEYTAVMQKAVEYLSHKDSAQNTAALVETMDAAAAYIASHRHSLIGKNHSRRKLMEGLQQKLMSCMNAVMISRESDKKEPNGIARIMKELNKTFCADGGSEEFRNVMKQMNLMRISGSLAAAALVQETARKYIASHGSPRLSMGKKRLDLMKQLEAELGLWAGTRSLDEEAIDKKLDFGISNDPYNINGLSPEQEAEQAKEKADVTKRCSKKEAGIKDLMEDYKTNLFTTSGTSPAKVVYYAVDEFLKRAKQGKANQEEVDSLCIKTKVALAAETYKYKQLTKTLSMLPGDYDYKANGTFMEDYLATSMDLLKKTVSKLKSIGVENGSISNKEAVERARTLGMIGNDFYSLIKELKDAADEQGGRK